MEFETESPSPPLTRSKSESALLISEEENVNTEKNRIFIRQNSSRMSTRRSRYKNKGNTLPKLLSTADNMVKKLAREFEELAFKTKSNYTIQPRIELANTEMQEGFLENVIINKTHEMNKYRKSKRSKSLQSFVEAEYEDTENYRKSLIEEMDLELAEMKRDGFLDEDENIVAPDESVYFQPEISIGSNFENVQETSNISKSPVNEVNNSSSNADDEYGERLWDDEENGSYIVEAFNDDGRELILVQVIIDRKAVNLETFQSIGETTQESDILFLDNNDKTLGIIQDQSEDSITCTTGETLGSVKSAVTNGLENTETTNFTNGLHSNRSTIYSTTSQDSSFHESDYEDIFVSENNNITADTELELTQENTETGPHSYRSTVYSTISGDSYENDDKSNDAKRIYMNVAGCSKDDSRVFTQENPNYLVILHSNTFGYSKVSDDGSLKDYEVIPNEIYDKTNENVIALEPKKEFTKPSDHTQGTYSNRSTIYSTSSLDEDKAEVNYNYSYNNTRRNTFHDDNGVVRIERVGYPGNITEVAREPSPAVSRSNSLSPLRKLHYIVDEMKSTEKKYVQDLRKVVRIYKPYIKKHTPPHLMERQHYLFGNISVIYQNQKRFLAELEHCGNNISNAVRIFIDHENLLLPYPLYFKNKPRADSYIRDFASIITQMQDKYEERLDLSAYLLTPVQRLGKYILFLENIHKQLKKLELPVSEAQLALDIVKAIMSRGNDYVAIESIINSHISKSDFGSFKMRERFNIVKPRRLDAMVFLFENIVVFTMNSQLNIETFTYCDSIKMKDLRIATFEDSTIHLTDFTKSKKNQNSSRYTYVLEAKTEKIKNHWRDTIESILWQQLCQAKETSMKMNHQQSKKGKPERNRLKSAGSSVFYVD